MLTTSLLHGVQEGGIHLPLNREKPFVVGSILSSLLKNIMLSIVFFMGGDVLFIRLFVDLLNSF